MHQLCHPEGRLSSLHKKENRMKVKGLSMSQQDITEFWKPTHEKAISILVTQVTPTIGFSHSLESMLTVGTLNAGSL